jgi:GNAT superfamily N-acetyltransferase
LKPVFKHGEHDQSSHGNWATQGYSEDEIKRIESMKSLGPKKEDLDKVWDSAKSNEIDRDKAEMMIDNDSFLNDTIEQTISDRYDQKETELGRVLSEDERVQLYDEYRNDAINSLIDSEPDYLENFSQENGYGSLKNAEAASELQDAFNDVYSVEHEGTFREGTENAGQSVTLRSEVTNVVVDGDGIHVYSNVYDEDGNLANTSREVERIFVKDEASGTWSVEHEWFELDEAYRGTGFGGQFLRQSEDWYIAQGLTHISTLGGLDDGARHWANAGFDFERDNLDAAVGTIRQGITQQEYQLDGIREKYGDSVANSWQENISTAKTLLSRMVDDNGNIKDMTNDDFPKPHDFSSLGSKTPFTVERDGEQRKMWFGKAMLEGRAIYYVKALTAEGRNLLAGPIDMDGDGMVYDGTPREKPASSKKD